MKKLLNFLKLLNEMDEPKIKKNFSPEIEKMIKKIAIESINDDIEDFSEVGSSNIYDIIEDYIPQEEEEKYGDDWKFIFDKIISTYENYFKQIRDFAKNLK